MQILRGTLESGCREGVEAMVKMFLVVLSGVLVLAAVLTLAGYFMPDQFRDLTGIYDPDYDEDE